MDSTTPPKMRLTKDELQQVKKRNMWIYIGVSIGVAVIAGVVVLLLFLPTSKESTKDSTSKDLKYYCPGNVDSALCTFALDGQTGDYKDATCDGKCQAQYYKCTSGNCLPTVQEDGGKPDFLCDGKCAADVKWRCNNDQQPCVMVDKSTTGSKVYNTEADCNADPGCSKSDDQSINWKAYAQPSPLRIANDVNTLAGKQKSLQQGYDAKLSKGYVPSLFPLNADEARDKKLQTISGLSSLQEVVLSSPLWILGNTVPCFLNPLVNGSIKSKYICAGSVETSTSPYRQDDKNKTKAVVNQNYVWNSSTNQPNIVGFGASLEEACFQQQKGQQSSFQVKANGSVSGDKVLCSGGTDQTRPFSAALINKFGDTAQCALYYSATATVGTDICSPAAITPGDLTMAENIAGGKSTDSTTVTLTQCFFRDYSAQQTCAAGGSTLKGCAKTDTNRMTYISDDENQSYLETTKCSQETPSSDSSFDQCKFISLEGPIQPFNDECSMLPYAIASPAPDFNQDKSDYALLQSSDSDYQKLFDTVGLKANSNNPKDPPFTGLGMPQYVWGKVWRMTDQGNNLNTVYSDKKCYSGTLSTVQGEEVDKCEFAYANLFGITVQAEGNAQGKYQKNWGNSTNSDGNDTTLFPTIPYLEEKETLKTSLAVDSGTKDYSTDEDKMMAYCTVALSNVENHTAPNLKRCVNYICNQLRSQIRTGSYKDVSDYGTTKSYYLNDYNITGSVTSESYAILDNKINMQTFDFACRMCDGTTTPCYHKYEALKEEEPKTLSEYWWAFFLGAIALVVIAFGLGFGLKK